MSTPTPTIHGQVLRLQEVSRRLLAALEVQRQAKAAYDQARDHLEDLRCALTLAGVPGVRERCPAEEREAHLTRALSSEIQAVRLRREELRAAETRLEAARVEERTERETLRSMQRNLEFQGAQAQAS